MTARRPFRVLQRWRRLISAGVLIGALVGWVSAAGAPREITTFEAVHTLILDPGAGTEAEVKRLNEVLATLGPVPDRVAARLGLDPRQVRSMVTAQARSPGLLLITGRSADRTQAEMLANVTAEELIVELGGRNSPLRTLEPAVASPVKSEGVKGPKSRTGRAFILAGFGLVLGAGAAFVVERFDSRIRSKTSAEAAIDGQVMAEVPPLTRADRGCLLTAQQSSSFIEAHRGLRTSVDRWAGRQPNGDGRPVIVVASPVGEEGTTTTVAHLAVAMAEIGRSVLVISADLRHPLLHIYFGRGREPGLADVLRGAPDARRLADLNRATGVPGVQFVASGAPVRNPAPLLDNIGDHLLDARTLADVVLVDAPALLTTSDGADLARHADGVLLVLRAGRTSVGAATRSADLLKRLDVPMVGAVLIGQDGSAG